MFGNITFLRLVTWQEKGHELHPPSNHAAYWRREEFWKHEKDFFKPSNSPRFADPVSRSQISYLSGCGGGRKTTRDIRLLKSKDPLVLTLTHRPEKHIKTVAQRPRSTTVSSGARQEQVDTGANWPDVHPHTENLGAKFGVRISRFSSPG